MNYKKNMTIVVVVIIIFIIIDPESRVPENFMVYKFIVMFPILKTAQMG